MKKIYIALLACALFACEDLLQEEPKSVAVETFYNTATEVESAVFAIYAPLRHDNAFGSLYPAQLEAYTDYGYGRGSYTSLNEFQGVDPTNQTRVGQIWEQFYLAIRNANIVISKAPQSKSLAPADLAKYVAEARFLRAFTYFTLVRNWNGVPLRTESNLEEIEIKRHTAEEVYQLILEDLAFAEANLPDVPALTGRPSMWAAKAVLADVYLQRNQFSEARDKAGEVIKSAKYALINVAVADDFLKVFGADVTKSPEEVFYLKFSRTGNAGWTFPMFAHHPGSVYLNKRGYFAHYTDAVLNPVMQNWNSADLRKGYNTYLFNIGLGANTYLFNKFRDPLTTGNFGANDYPLYRYADVLLLYAEAAARANASGMPTPEAVEALNMVHRRAYGKTPNQASEVDFQLTNFATAESFTDTVIKERGYETMYEGKRWLDLKRIGKVKEIIKATKGKDVADKHLLWPIPASELNYNKVLDPAKDQNPGY